MNLVLHPFFGRTSLSSRGKSSEAEFLVYTSGLLIAALVLYLGWSGAPL